MSAGDFVYCDPPYFLTSAVYNEKRGFTGWGEKEEIELLAFLDKADSLGLRFALSNVLRHKGQTNELLDSWRQKYNTHTLTFDYSNSSYNLKKALKATESLEVLVTNY